MQYGVQTHSLIFLFFEQTAWNMQTMLYYVLAFLINTRMTGRGRETREGWPLQTVNEVNADSWSANKRDPSLVGSLGLSCRFKRFLFCLCCLVGPVQNIFFLAIHYFSSFFPIAQEARQEVVLGHLLFSICLWVKALSIIASNFNLNSIW